MREVILTNTFERISKKLFKKDKETLKLFEERVNLLKVDPFDSKLKTHKLNGTLKDFYSCSLNYYYRLIFNFDKESITLYSIGNHDDVY